MTFVTKWTFEIGAKKLKVIFSNDGYGIVPKVESDDDKELAKRLTDTLVRETDIDYCGRRMTDKRIWDFVRKFLIENNAKNIVIDKQPKIIGAYTS